MFPLPVADGRNIGFPAKNQIVQVLRDRHRDGWLLPVGTAVCHESNPPFPAKGYTTQYMPGGREYVRKFWKISDRVLGKCYDTVYALEQSQ